MKQTKRFKKLIGLVLAIAITVTMIPVSGIEAKAQTTTSDRVAELVEEMSLKAVEKYFPKH